MSIHASQALALLNSPFLEAQSRNFARRVLAETGSRTDFDALVARAYEIAVGRSPRDGERQRAVRFIEEQRRLVEREFTNSRAETSGTTIAEALADLCLVIFNLNESVFVD